ncbi:hypothetical protein C8R46DRAFT_1358097 [Mycena filopes]|nr:hypothetical protein C8R46DRAFT_1358097 [Mycena filopes]
MFGIPRSAIRTFRPLLGSRGLASLPARRPRYLWDFHIPKNSWGYWHREEWLKPPANNYCQDRARNWVSIPDANLPHPWTCDWARWPHWAADSAEFRFRPLEGTLAASYALSDAPLTPVMFNYVYKVFGCAGSGKFYLYRAVELPSEEQLGPVDAFHGVFSSVDAFIEQADWNSVERLKLVSGETIVAPTASPIAPALPLVNLHGFRVAAQEPYQKRTLMDLSPPPGTLGYLPRTSSRWRFPTDKYPRVSEWPRRPDSALPEPWTSDWELFPGVYEWYSERQLDLEEAFGRPLVGYIPALFREDDGGRGDTVLCPPGGAGTYYLWASDLAIECYSFPSVREMQRFRGVFASVEHFIRVADWNTLEEVPRLVYRDGYWEL